MLTRIACPKRNRYWTAPGCDDGRVREALQEKHTPPPTFPGADPEPNPSATTIYITNDTNITHVQQADALQLMPTVVLLAIALATTVLLWP